MTRFVDEQGRTDFDALAGDRKDLDEFVALVARVSPATSPALFPRSADVLAYHLNAYNALAMKGVIDEASLTASRVFSSASCSSGFAESPSAAGRMSLSTYENDVIRPLGEPRVHFALNCMARSCPRLPQAAFSADELEAQLKPRRGSS